MIGDAANSNISFVSALDSCKNTTKGNSQRTEETANPNGFAANDLKAMNRDPISRNCVFELFDVMQLPLDVQVSNAPLQIHAETSMVFTW